MYQKIIALCLLSAWSLGAAWAQLSIGDYRAGFSQDGNVLSFSYENADLRLEFCTEDVVRVRTSWARAFAAPEPYMVVQYDWPAVAFANKETEEAFTFTTDRLRIVLGKSPFSLHIYNDEGDLLTSVADQSKAGDAVASRHALQAGEHFFGFGERMDALDRRGMKTELYVGRGEKRPHIIGAYNVLEANYCPVPFFMSTRGYGIFLHNSYRNHWDMGNSDADSYTLSAEGGELDYYVFYGPDFGTMLDRYTDLTGKSPMMNRFAFGLHVGTYSGGTWGHEEMTSGQYVIALARKFRQLGIPLDILHLDSTWRIFGENGGKGATSFEWRETFVDPVGMFDSLYALNLNMVGVHLRPRFDNGKTLRLLDTARALGHVYPEQDNPGEFVNYFDEEAVDWWWEHGVMRVAEQGAMFLKTDEGSAFGRKANESKKIGPRGEEIRRLHNVFPLAYAKAPYEKFQAYHGLRGMNHTREGYAGIQRYPFIFAGDWPSEWQYFAPVIKAGLNLGLSGVGYWAHCMGGFEHEADPELYVRWCQFGLMSSVAHLFGMDHPSYKEPWNYGQEAMRIFRSYDSLRYSLIPYLYSMGWEQYQTGMPLMRALVLAHQNDVNTYRVDDQYLLGESILVCPVTTKGAKTRSLYLPEGVWYSHWDGQVYQGKQHIHVVTPLAQMPIFYRAGSIVPSQEPIQYVDQKPLEKVILHLYGGANASFDLYDDDGRSLAYQDGAYTLTAIRYEESKEAATLSLEETTSGYQLPTRTYEVRLRTERKPQAILLGKKPIEEWRYDQETGMLTFAFEKPPGQKVAISIQ